MNKRPTVEAKLSDSQFERLLTLLDKKSATRRPSPWIQVLVVPLAIAFVGTWLTWSYNRKLEEINRVQTMEKFVAYFGQGHSTEQQVAGLATMIELGYQDLAADFLVLTIGNKAQSVQEQVFPLLMAKGDKLLPRLCQLTESSGGSEVPANARRYAQRVIVEADASFETLKNLALSSNTEPSTREGAL